MTSGARRSPIGPLSIAALAVLLALAVAFVAPAQAKRNLYVGGVFGPGVAALDIGPTGALSPVPGSPYGTPSTDGVVLTPDGSHLYVTSAGTGQALAYDVNTDGSLTAIPGVELGAGNDPTGIAVSPGGSHVYVADPTPEAIRTYSIGPDGTLTPAGLTPLGGANGTTSVAITPNGDYLYAAVAFPPAPAIHGFAIGADGSLTALPTPPVNALVAVESLSVTPNGGYLYAASAGIGGVQAFSIGADGSLATVPGSPFAAGVNHPGLAVSPLGSHIFVANEGSPDAVEALAIAADGALSAVPGSPFAAADEVAGIALTPDGSRLYTSGDITAGNVSAFDVAPGGALTPIAGTPFPSGVGLPIFQSLAVSPNQAPTASFTAVRQAVRYRIHFDARGSSDADGAIVRYAWAFGDGRRLANGGPTPTHTYRGPGTYTATLTVTDDEGCSTTFVFTGQTASCNGSAAALAERPVTVAAPRLPPRLALQPAPRPALRLFGPRRQKLDRAIELRASCDRRCTVAARGKLLLRVPGAKASVTRRLNLRRITRRLPAGKRVTLKVKLRKGQLRRARSALSVKGGKVRAKLVVRATDTAGLRSAPARRTIRLTLPRKR